jgi:hypothetical protein
MSDSRSPAGWLAQLTANTRPQPAIPGVLLLMLTFIGALVAGPDGWAVWWVPIGIALSCSVAIAAGFCSLFPQLAWITLALWGLSLVGRGALAEPSRYVLLVGIVAAVLMFAVQLWRIRTARFVPTITDQSAADY